VKRLKRKACLILLMLFLSPEFFAALPQGIRAPRLAGQWYDRDPSVLAGRIDAYLRRVDREALPPGKVLAVMVPHAAYVYSGQIAAFAYRTVQGMDVESVIILAPAHRFGFQGCSIYPRGGYATPLGTAPVDESLAAALSEATGFSFMPRAHKEEHAVEIQVPFIQRALPRAKIVPVVMGYPRKETIVRLAEGLKKAIAGKKALIIASTDMSHFLSRKEARKKDAGTLDLIKNFQVDRLIRKCERGENIMCGGGPVAAVMLCLRERAGFELLRYGDSSDVTGDESRVVGYAAGVFVERRPSQPFSLSRTDQVSLLRMARTAITRFVKEGVIPDLQTESAPLLEKHGAFVTLTKNGRLRGCIGYMESALPLYQTVIRAAVFAASRDPRFRPVTSEELDDLEIEISVLSPLKKISDPSAVKVGKHGLFIAKNGKTGVLLPQVAAENRWNRETFLRQVCLKAGLDEEAWSSGAELFVFEALVFR